MRVVVVSDTHNNFPALPEGDLLIHCGDFSAHGTVEELERAAQWLASQPHAQKIAIPGNHDRCLEGEPEILRRVPRLSLLVDQFLQVGPLKIWGSPWTPLWQGFAFMQCPDAMAARWRLIPEGLDILVTHGPPRGILDMTLRGEPVGCCELWDRMEKIKPKYHVFGHIHEAYGMEKLGETTFINASWVALDRHGPKPANPSVVLDL